VEEEEDKASTRSRRRRRRRSRSPRWCLAESKREKRDEGLGRSRAAENKGRIGEVHDNATV
jgi:hypothetical protein